MTRIRLGWEARIDQVTVLVLFAVIGVGLVFLGAGRDWPGWLTVPMIVIGILFLLIVLLRLSGWRSMWWPRDLVVSESAIAYEAKRGGAFQIPWSDLAAVGVHSDNGVDELYGLILVFFPKSANVADRVLSTKILRLPRNGALKVRLPRREGIVEAIRDTAPRDWQRVPATPWHTLVAAAGVAPQVVPAPDPRPPVVVNTGKRTRWQALIGGVLAVAASVGFLSIIFGQSQGGAGVKVFGAVLGIPFIVLAGALVMYAPMIARGRHVVVDADSFTWDDPSGDDSFMLGWPEITSVAVETSITRSGPTTWSGRRRLDNILVHTQKDNKRVSLGSQPASVEQIAAAVQQFSPQLWYGAKTGTAGPFQLK